MLLTSVAVAAILTGAMELRAQMLPGDLLQIVIVARGPATVVVTPRTTLGCYVEVEVQDETGVVLGHLGPRASCPRPGVADFQAFCADADDSASPQGAPLFGMELDLRAPERFRLRPNGIDSYEPERGKDYRLVVIYHNDDSVKLDAKNKARLMSKFPNAVLPGLNLRAAPVHFRREK